MSWQSVAPFYHHKQCCGLGDFEASEVLARKRGRLCRLDLSHRNDFLPWAVTTHTYQTRPITNILSLPLVGRREKGQRQFSEKSLGISPSSGIEMCVKANCQNKRHKIPWSVRKSSGKVDIVNNMTAKQIVSHTGKSFSIQLFMKVITVKANLPAVSRRCCPSQRLLS